MGMFDSVYVNCPACKARVELQSKAGDCMLNDFELFNAPPIIQADLARYSPYECTSCGYLMNIHTQAMSFIS